MKLKASAAILAGGENKRNKGFPKIFEQVDGQKLIHKQLKVLETLFDDIVIVAAENLTFDEDCPHRIVHDLFPGKGPLAGIHSALHYAKNESVFCIAGDMPYPDARIIQKLWSAFSKNASSALIPSHQKGREPLYAFYRKSAIVPIEDCLKKMERPRIMCITDFIQYTEMHFSPIPKCFENVNSFR
ncbi:MAG: molybdenum cofactor guanylyltransferase [Bacteroidales bacterium]|nr:molybdenum cofactor guanylyltransferase [Bacteroidales bacterium]